MRKAVLPLLHAALFLSLVLPAASQAQDKQSGQKALDPPSWSSWEPYAPPAASDTTDWRWTPEGARRLGLVPPARWLSVDPLAEKHPDWTPYNYVLANPLILIDPDGRQVRADLADFNAYSPYGTLQRGPGGRPQFNRAKAQADAVGGLLGLGTVLAPQLALWALRNPFAAGLAGTNVTAAGMELLNDSPMDVCPACFGDDAVRGGKLLFKSLNKAGDVRVTAGISDKIAVIGRGQFRVRGLAQEIGAETFIPSQTAKSELRKLRKVHRGNIPPEVLRTTIMYSENQKWLRNVKARGYTVVDIGSLPGAGPSVFYEMEREVVYGVGN